MARRSHAQPAGALPGTGAASVAPPEYVRPPDAPTETGRPASDPLDPPNPPSESEETRHPSSVNAKRGAAAVREYQDAQRRARTPGVDWSARALQPIEVAQAVKRAKSLLEPGKIAEGAGEAVPALGDHEPYNAARHIMVDTLERPTTVGVRASEQRLELVERLGILQAAVDTALTVQARNSVEKMLAHQLAAAHKGALNLMAYLPGMDTNPSPFRATAPPAEIARMANAAARLMEAFASGCRVLHILKTGGTQRVIVQHQQVVMAKDGDAVLVSRSGHGRHRGRTARRRHGRNPK